MFLSAFADEATRQQVQSLGALDYLIKPLDVGQIVPAVEAAFVRVRGQGTAAAGLVAPIAPAAAPAAAPALAPAVADPVPLAVGVLMHRYSLSRDGAWQRLQRLAADQKLSVPAQAERLLAAVEELARSAL
jgi:two-component system, response regulator PdtaR